LVSPASADSLALVVSPALVVRQALVSLALVSLALVVRPALVSLALVSLALVVALFSPALAVSLALFSPALFSPALERLPPLSAATGAGPRRAKPTVARPTTSP